MRMWKVNPKLLCRKHLLGEHLEMHMFLGAIENNKPLQGYINSGLVEIHNIKKRHDKLAEEMLSRGYNHKSPMNLKFNLPKGGKVDVDKNIEELQRRCEECKRRIEE